MQAGSVFPNKGPSLTKWGIFLAAKELIA